VEFCCEREVRFGRCRNGETSEIPFQIGVSDLSKSYINRPGRIYLKTKPFSDLIWMEMGLDLTAGRDWGGNFAEEIFKKDPIS